MMRASAALVDGTRVIAVSPGGRRYSGVVHSSRVLFTGALWYLVEFFADGRREEMEFPSGDVRCLEPA
jgi:hypothetical protein